jgi:hypothetical protein
LWIDPPGRTVVNLRLPPLFAAALIACALTAAAGQAAGQPPFPRSFRGTISGTLDARDSSQGTRTRTSWTIEGLALRLTRVVKSDAGWSAFYAVTSGKIRYHEAETGSCSYSFDTTLPLRTSLDKTSAPFALSQSLFSNHPTTALGSMAVKHGFNVTERCAQRDGQPTQVSKRAITLAELFDPGETRVALARRFAGHNSSHDSSTTTNSTTKWSWVLTPGR